MNSARNVAAGLYGPSCGWVSPTPEELSAATRWAEVKFQGKARTNAAKAIEAVK